MFCPNCKCEFRAGFTRCGSCDTDLVEDLNAVEAEEPENQETPLQRIELAEVCGFLDLDAARRARDLLWQHQIYSELSVRSSPETVPGGPVIEEVWMRADVTHIRQVHQLLDRPAPEPQTVPADAAQVRCSKCDTPVREEETFCANCGTRFSN